MLNLYLYTISINEINDENFLSGVYIRSNISNKRWTVWFIYKCYKLILRLNIDSKVAIYNVHSNIIIIYLGEYLQYD